ncbi:hypothetical protein B0H13DRAFT_1902773 [Mycena leptocephala]|nr:hypothetical protein B0H13DRAFT_1902773 [Mycena leptocephala]
MAFATPASVIEQPEAVDGVVPVEQPDDNHLDPDYNNDDSGRGSDGEDGSYNSSDTSEEEDNANDSELDDAVAQIAPPSVRVKIPPAKFDIPFEVPYKNGMRDLKGITSVTTFDEFLAAAAGKMGTRITQMDNIANPKPIPKILDDDGAWEALVGDVRQHGKKSDRDSDETQAVPVLKEHQLFKEIEKTHYCQECKTSRHKATLNDAPSDLGLAVNHKRQVKAKKNLANASTSAYEPPMWVQSLVPVIGVFLATECPTFRLPPSPRSSSR